MLETTVIEEFASKNKNDKKELTVFDFIMSYSQNNLFELKATRNTKEHASPRQVVAVVTLPKQEPVQHAQIVDENKHESTSIPSS